MVTIEGDFEAITYHCSYYTGKMQYWANSLWYLVTNIEVGYTLDMQLFYSSWQIYDLQ